MIRVLMIGDVFGSPGRQCVERMVPGLRKELGLDLVVANGENAAGGLGITPRLAQELFLAGVDVITTGNHVWRHRELLGYLDEEPHILRPENYPPGAPGTGHVLVHLAGVKVGVVNLEGRVFMSPLDCPFRTADRLLAGPLAKADLVLVDMHAEASSEKLALGRYLDGRVAAVVGTHTHVQTADQKLLPKGTAYLTDLGMTGPHNSVIGVRPDLAIGRFLAQRYTPFEVSRGDHRLQGAVLELDPAAGTAVSIERLDRRCAE